MTHSSEAAEILQDQAQAVNVIAREKVFDGRVWDVYREEFEYDSGVLVRDFVSHPGAAGVVALDDEDRVLLIQQYRHPVRCREWELPAGLLDVPGEDPQQAAARELAEEASLAADHFEHLLSVWTTPGGNNEVVHIYLAQSLHEVESGFVPEGEEAQLRKQWVPLAEVVQAILAGRMRNSLLINGILALWAKRSNPVA